jgi:hypothetical protein
VQHLKMLPVDYIGTDPGTASNIADQRFDLRRCSGTRRNWPSSMSNCTPRRPNPGPEKMSVAKGLAYVTAFVEDHAYREAGVTPPSDRAWMATACRSACASYAPTRPGHWPAGPRRRSCTTARCRRSTNCSRLRTNAVPPSIKARSSTTRSTWA